MQPSSADAIGNSGRLTQRRGDEIAIGGTLVHTGTRVILWSDPGGMNAYPSQHFGPRRQGASMSYPQLRAAIDQFVIHYDDCGSSRRCFDVLNQRGLSVQFLLDTDGTIYQILDCRERAWHATKANTRSVGVEIANTGAVPVAQRSTLAASAGTRQVNGILQGQRLVMNDYTRPQYEALTRLTAALCTALPLIRCDAPRGADGRVTDHVLSPAEFDAFHGLIGHYHIQPEKIDPGPAFDWDGVINGARRLMARSVVLAE